jgi:hypothetical protein
MMMIVIVVSAVSVIVIGMKNGTSAYSIVVAGIV